MQDSLQNTMQSIKMRQNRHVFNSFSHRHMIDSVQAHRGKGVKHCSSQQTDIHSKTHHCFTFGGAIDSYIPQENDHRFLTILITPWPPCTSQLY